MFSQRNNPYCDLLHFSEGKTMNNYLDFQNLLNSFVKLNESISHEKDIRLGFRHQ